VVAAVAVGAFAAAAAGQTLQASRGSSDGITPLANGRDGKAAFGVGGETSGNPGLLASSRSSDGAEEARRLAEAEQASSARQARLQQLAEAKARAEQEARRPKCVRPADGIYTSGFGARWGATHYGIDIANSIGTPIRAAMDGVVIEAGPASGFGLWVRLQHADDTVTVYGHVDSYSVHEGQTVKAGQQIARMGNRGNSTGPHLHFEVWLSDGGQKIDPKPWLAARGVSL